MTHDTAPEPGDLTGRRRLRADRARLVADVIRQQILRGAYTVLPDERSLGQQFDASRNTIRDALDLLRADGLIERQQGVGTIVVARKYAHGLNQLMGLAETLHEHGAITNEVRAASVLSAPRMVAARLELDEGAKVVYIERLRWLNDLPLSLDVTYLPMDVGEPLLTESLPTKDIFGLLEQLHGQSLGVADIGMEAVNADPHSAMILQVPRGSALLLVERLSHAKDHPEVLDAFLKAQTDATQYLNSDPMAAAQSVARQTKLPVEVVYLYNGPNGMVTFDTALRPELK